MVTKQADDYLNSNQITFTNGTRNESMESMSKRANWNSDRTGKETERIQLSLCKVLTVRQSIDPIVHYVRGGARKESVQIFRGSRKGGDAFGRSGIA